MRNFLLNTLLLGTLFSPAITLLNTPEKKLQTRLTFLNGLRSKIEAMRANPLLKSEEPELKETLTKIESVLKLANAAPHPTASQESKLELAVKSVQKNINSLKQDLVKKAFEINKELQDKMKRVGITSANEKRESLFEKLMECQDANLSDQVAVVVQFFAGNEASTDSSSDETNRASKTNHMSLLKQKLETIKDNKLSAFVKKVTDSAYPEGSNLAMELGLILDAKTEDSSSSAMEVNRSEDNKASDSSSEKSSPDSADKMTYTTLARTAHLTETQSKTLLPILLKVERQKVDKEHRLTEIEKKLAAAEVSERFLRKHKAVLSRETLVLSQAASAIRGGEVAKLSKAIKELQSLEGAL